MTVTESLAPRGAPHSARFVDGACVVFAVFTLCCHATVASGGSLRRLVLLFGLALLGLGLLGPLGRAWRRRGRGSESAATGSPVAAGTWRPALQLGGFSIGVGASVLFASQPILWWWSAIALLGAAAVAVAWREAPAATPPADGRGIEAGLWLLAAGCVALALSTHRYDVDDAFYVNLAVAAADAPTQPILVGDTLHGIPGLPLHLPVYRAHSWEMWNAALSWLTGLPAIACFHLLSSALAAFLVPLSLARLARWLAPGTWLAVVFATLVVLVSAGDAHRWYGNFAFVRIWQGKSVFLWVFLPLVAAYAVEFARRPSAGVFARLAAAQIAAVGCTSSAFWAAPATALAALACAIPLTRRGLRTLTIGALASVYVLGAGLVVKGEWDAWRTQRRPTTSAAPAASAARSPAAPQAQRGTDLGRALWLLTADSPLRIAILAAAASAWACCPPGLGRRYAIVVPLAVLLVLLNPYAGDWMKRNAIGPSYWRGLWALPVPLLLGLALTGSLAWSGRWRVAGRVAAPLALALFAVAVPSVPGLGTGNDVEFDWPRLKVRNPPHAWARALHDAVEPGTIVVAPHQVAPWLPTFHQLVYPVVVRGLYLRPYEYALGEEIVLHRVLMQNFAEGTAVIPNAHVWFARGLERFDVGAVLLRSSPKTAQARRVLRASGFERGRADNEYEIWVRRG